MIFKARFQPRRGSCYLKFIYKRGTELYVADTLSRSYINEKSDPDVDEQVNVLSLTSISPACMAKIQKLTLLDPVMQKVTHFICNGRPAKSKSVPPEAQPYFPIRDELILDHGAILKGLRGLRVVVPQTLHKEYLRQLHKGHPGIDATKRRARETVYWPSLMLDIDSDVALCQPCNSA